MESIVYLFFWGGGVCPASNFPLSLGTFPPCDFRRSNSFPHLKIESPLPPTNFMISKVKHFPTCCIHVGHGLCQTHTPSPEYEWATRGQAKQRPKGTRSHINGGVTAARSSPGQRWQHSEPSRASHVTGAGCGVCQSVSRCYQHPHGNHCAI